MRIQFVAIFFVMMLLSLSLNAKIVDYNKVQSQLSKDNPDTSKVNSVNEDEVFDPFFRLYLGGFHSFSQTSLALNSATLGRGTDLDVESIFGEERKIFPRVEAIFNVGKRHEIGLTYWAIRKKRSAALDRDIQFGDTTFYINTSVEARFNFSNYGFTYRYAILANEHWFAGASLGFKLVDIEAGLKANLNERSYGNSKRLYAPLPLVGLHAAYKTSEHFLVRSTFEYFGLNIDDYRFRVLDFRTGVEYYPIKNLGIGADYHFFNTNFKKVPSGELDGNIDFRFNAISLYLALRL